MLSRFKTENKTLQPEIKIPVLTPFPLFISFAGNPLSQDILNLYQEPDGTRKLLNYMLDNLAGKSQWLFFYLFVIHCISFMIEVASLISQKDPECK